MAHDQETARFTLASAVDAMRAGQLAQWVGDFLASHGSDNLVLAAALAERPHAWFGPVRIPLEQLERLAGPDRGAICHIDAVEWKHDLERMEASIRQGWEAPPLIVELRDDHLLLQDGNHRREALLREGRDEGWAIIYCDDDDALERFRARFAATEPR